MGCGRSRHSSPTLTADALAFKGDNKENRRGGKRQKLSDKNNSKAAVKHESSATPTKTTNGKTGGAKGESVQKGGGSKQQGGGAKQQGGRAKPEEAGARREWQLEEAVEASETVMAVYRSSVPASTRTSQQAAAAATAAVTTSTNIITSTTTTSSVNGSLINGAHHRPTAQEISVPDKTAHKDRAASAPSNAKPVHVTSSQLEFFRMLDEKIEGGPDYISDDD
ncbi:uncharacterized protein LOC112575825 isoform X2 [Pomacea canaliculata]|uniref:uncharacterized protein LOC112575825 isoform X2 n=1 Tax=Pomacea canaliculata TaxID=400727 RepID=UPI000D726F8D|nr:uncharacterized protein LOC112575825 isoform X2 [Pomacea canaliculata]